MTGARFVRVEIPFENSSRHLYLNWLNLGNMLLLLMKKSRLTQLLRMRFFKEIKTFHGPKNSL